MNRQRGEMKTKREKRKCRTTTLHLLLNTRHRDLSRRKKQKRERERVNYDIRFELHTKNNEIKQKRKKFKAKKREEEMKNNNTTHHELFNNRHRELRRRKKQNRKKRSTVIFHFAQCFHSALIDAWTTCPSSRAKRKEKHMTQISMIGTHRKWGRRRKKSKKKEKTKRQEERRNEQQQHVTYFWTPEIMTWAGQRNKREKRRSIWRSFSFTYKKQMENKIRLKNNNTSRTFEHQASWVEQKETKFGCGEEEEADNQPSSLNS